MSEEFWSGFYSGSLATLVGFILTMIWDLWKTWRQDKSRDASSISALKHELEENLQICQGNIGLLSNELAVLGNIQILQSVATPLKNGILDVLKINLPQKILNDIDTLSLLRDTSIMINKLNEGLRSRQHYKDTCGAMTNFHRYIAGLNQVLIHELQELEQLTRRANEKITLCVKS